MAINSVFACTFVDCLVPCLITFFVTLFILTIVHIIIYYKLVKLAKQRYGIEGFENHSFKQIKHLLYIK